jgi:hypothetical protein
MYGTHGTVTIIAVLHYDAFLSSTMASTKTSTYSPLETEQHTEAEAHAVEIIGLPSVLVKAPSDLPGGYHLCVEINGKKTLVAIVRTVLTVAYLIVHGIAFHD